MAVYNLDFLRDLERFARAGCDATSADGKRREMRVIFEKGETSIVQPKLKSKRLKVFGGRKT